MDPVGAGTAGAYLIPAVGLLAAGLLLWRGFRRAESPPLRLQDGGVIVLLAWVSVCLVSAVPFLLAGGLDLTQAVFESVSGWTTTGLSVLDVTHAPPSLLLWRSTMQLAGGAGLAVIMLAAILGRGGIGLYAAEGRSDQLVPHVRRSARLVLLLYLGFTAAGILGYLALGLGPFDAVNHTFAAVSTGGFSTRADSIGFWNSFPIEIWTVVLMVLGNLNFATGYLLVQGRFRAVWRNGEVRVMAWLLPAAVASVYLLVTRGAFAAPGKDLRVAFFECASALTTTGFSTVGYGHWSDAGILTLIVLMLVGGGTCSTAGGLKQARVFLLVRSVAWEVRRMLAPPRAVLESRVWGYEGPRFVGDGELRQVGAFTFLYLATWLVGSAILCGAGVPFRDALFEFASSVGTVGLSLGVTAPGASKVVLWTETLGMFLGRLEFLILFVSAIQLARDLPRLLSPSASRRRRPPHAPPPGPAPAQASIDGR